MPSEKILKEKQDIVAALAEKMQNASAGVFVSYSGLTVEKDTELRNNLRAAGVEYSVVKNTLTRRAAEQIGYTEFDEILNGTTALATHKDDVVAPAKVLCDFIAKYKDESGLTVKAGFMDGKACGVAEIDALSKIPSKDTLYAMLAGGLNATIAGLARAIQAVADKGQETA
ncbi:MAG: 50S ribosomal protein L10 [Ruminococcaceae bacterium]|nr:50S ribosomal protein L10 [Oscillospiraceae bacterium]